MGEPVTVRLGEESRVSVGVTDPQGNTLAGAWVEVTEVGEGGQPGPDARPTPGRGAS